MKALFISNDPLIFTEDSAVRARMRAYAAAIGELHVISKAPLEAREITEGTLTLHPIHANPFMRFSKTVALARKLVEEKQVEIVSTQDPFEHGLAGVFATMRTPALLHVQLHTDIGSRYFRNESWKNRVRVRIAPIVFFFADGVRVVSERVRAAVLGRYGRFTPPPRVIPVALPAHVPPAAPLPAHTFMFTLFALSRIEPEKRIEDLLAALVLVRRRYPNVGLFIAGDGSERISLIQKSLELGIGEHVVFLGWRTDGLALMQSAQAFINSSAYEGYGLSLLEAALAGVPVITTNVGIVGDVLVPEEDALVVKVGDTYALAEQIFRLIEKSDLGPTLAAHAVVKAKEHRDAYIDQPELIAHDLRATLGKP